MEYFSGPPVVVIRDLPAVRFQSLKPTGNTTMLQRLVAATRRRSFVLVEDWLVVLDKVNVNQELNGTFAIPALDDKGKPIDYDGASVPLPWLISVLTVGILRPLGVMLIASIIHDYAYKYGSLRKLRGVPAELDRIGPNEDQESEAAIPVDVPITREQADGLFRDTIRAVNRLPLVGQIAWLFVRMGWFFRVRFHGKPYGGDAPIAAFVITSLLLAVLIIAGRHFGAATLCLTVVFFYLAAYALSVLFRPDDSELA